MADDNPIELRQSTRPRGRSLAPRNFVIYLVVCSFVGFGLFPLYVILVTALKEPADTFAWPPAWLFTPTLESFEKSFVRSGARSVLSFIFNSLAITLASTFFAVLLGSMAAYGLARFRFRGNKYLSFWILSTRFMPAVAFIVPIFLIVQFVGLLDSHLALIIIYTSMNLSFAIWILRGFFRDIPIEFEEAALVDGYTPWQVFWRVALPLVRPGLAATGILSAIFAWNEFLYALILTQNNAATLPVYIAGFQATLSIDWGQYMATSFFAIVPIMIFTLALQRHLVRGLTFGAVR